MNQSPSRCIPPAILTSSSAMSSWNHTSYVQPSMTASGSRPSISQTFSRFSMRQSVAGKTDTPSLDQVTLPRLRSYPVLSMS